MPLKKLTFQPGINKEITRYANEQGWYDSDKVRFRQGLPEKIGGWERISADTFLGVCRSLNSWIILGGGEYVGLGTHLKFYLELGSSYFDITPIRNTTAAGEVTFSATDGSTTLTITDVDHGAISNDFVTYSGAITLGGAITADVLNVEHQISTIVDPDTYTITLPVAANASDTGNGGAAVVGEYQINTGPEIVQATSGWGSGPWGVGSWSQSSSTSEPLRLWHQANFGEDLVFAPYVGELYYWDATSGPSARGVLVSSLPGASDVPTSVGYLISSDLFRFTFAMGSNNLGDTLFDPLLVRWSDQEDVTNWTPQITNQAGSIRLSRGSEIMTAIQARQELLVWTDSSLYSLQYVGAPAVWAAQLVGSNTSIASQNSRAYANGVAYWMGKDSFYQYDGRVQPMNSSIRRYVFNDINRFQFEQCHAGTVEGFNEVWFFYCSANSNRIDRYVIYDYVDNNWAVGTLGRTAWLDSGLNDFPLAATYSYNLVEHEKGLDDKETATTLPINAFIRSGEFDLEDGDRVMYMWRCMPDMTFSNSTAANPSAMMEFSPRYNSGAPYNNPLSQGGISSGPVIRTTTVPVEEYTQQLNIRVRGRQMSLKVESNDLGVQWQLGTPRIDMRPDGRR